MGINKKIIETEAQVTVEDAFNIVTYTGNSSTQSITGVGFQPDLIWIKSRNINGANHNLYDSTRGAGKVIFPNLTNSELTTADMTGFSSDGFNFTGAAYDSNTSGNNYVAWCWRAGGNSNTYNVDGVGYSTRSAAGLNNGTIADAKFLGASVNTQAGFSIQHINGSGASAGQTIDTGLTQQAELLIIKRLDSTGNWIVPQDATDDYLFLNTTAAGTSITFTDYVSGTNNILYDFYEYVCYSFHSVEGYSKIGSYTGTSSSGNSVNVGFAPDWVLIKGVSAGSSWILHDTVRSDGTAHLRPNTSGAEDTGSNEQINFTSTGFSIRNSGATQINTSGDTYIYMAFKIT